MTSIFETLWTYFVSFIFWLTRARFVDQYPPKSVRYPDFFKTKWYSCWIGRFILVAGNTDDFPHLTYIIGRGRGYINSFQIVIRPPSEWYNQQMGVKYMGLKGKWFSDGRVFPCTPLFALYWSINPQIAPFNWFGVQIFLSTRGFYFRFYFFRPPPNYKSYIDISPGLMWGNWIPSIMRRLEARKLIEKELQDEEPSYDDSVKFCPDCERPNQFGELCFSCRQERQNEIKSGHDYPETIE